MPPNHNTVQRYPVPGLHGCALTACRLRGSCGRPWAGTARNLQASAASGSDWVSSLTLRAAALQRLPATELAKPLPSSRKATELAGEIRQLEATVVKLVGMLVPDPPAEAGPPKSAQHQAAARTRWDRSSHRQIGV